MYPNARVWHLAVSTGAAGERLTYMRRLEPGAADDQHYGLLLAGAVGISAEVRTSRQVGSAPSASKSVADPFVQYVATVAGVAKGGPGSRQYSGHVSNADC